MAVSLFTALAGNAEKHAALTNAVERDAFAAGTAIGATFIFVAWAMGAVILGLAAMLSRGRKEMIEIDS